MILSWHFNFVCWSTLLLSIVDPKARNELGNPLKKNLSDMLLETKLYKVIRLTAICDHIAILCNWVLLQIAAFCMCIYEFECWTKYWKTQHIRSCYDSIEGTIFFWTIWCFPVAYCYVLLVVTRFTRIYPYGDKRLIQSVSSEMGFTFLHLFENRHLI